MNLLQKVGAVAAAALVTGGAITAGTLIPGSDGDPDRIVGHTANVSYEIYVQDPLAVYLFPFADDPTMELVSLPIGTDEPFGAGDEFTLPVWARNEGAGELRGVNAYIIPIPGTPNGCGFCGDLVEMQGEMVNLQPWGEEMYTIHIEVPPLAQSGQREWMIVFDYIAEIEGAEA